MRNKKSARRFEINKPHCRRLTIPTAVAVAGAAAQPKVVNFMAVKRRTLRTPEHRRPPFLNASPDLDPEHLGAQPRPRRKPCQTGKSEAESGRRGFRHGKKLPCDSSRGSSPWQRSRKGRDGLGVLVCWGGAAGAPFRLPLRPRAWTLRVKKCPPRGRTSVCWESRPEGTQDQEPACSLSPPQQPQRGGEERSAAPCL